MSPSGSFLLHGSFLDVYVVFVPRSGPEQCTLAAALEVSPAALLMPPASSPFEAVELPGGVTGTASNGESSPQPQIRDPEMLSSGAYLLTF